TIGELGDTFSPVVTSGEKAYVGLSSGGLAVIDLRSKAIERGLFPTDQGAVVGRPLVMANAGRVIFATTGGAAGGSIYGFPIGGASKPLWRVETDGAVGGGGGFRDQLA